MLRRPTQALLALFEYASQNPSIFNYVVQSSTFQAELSTRPVAESDLFTLCDGIPRIRGPYSIEGPSDYASIQASYKYFNITRVQANTEIENVTRFPQPSPNCTIPYSQCSQQWNTYYTEYGKVWGQLGPGSTVTQSNLAVTYPDVISEQVVGSLGQPRCDPVAPGAFASSSYDPNQCTVLIDRVQLFVWPESLAGDYCGVQETITPTATGLVTAVLNGTIFTSPSVYLSINKAGLSTAGGLSAVRSNLLVSVDPDQLSSGRGFHGMDPYSFNLGDIAGPVPYPAYANQRTCSEPQLCLTIFNNYAPGISVPPQITALDPRWNSCVPGLFPGWDPPHILTPVNRPAAPTASNPFPTVTQPTPVQSPTNTSPKQTGAPAGPHTTQPTQPHQPSADPSPEPSPSDPKPNPDPADPSSAAPPPQSQTAPPPAPPSQPSPLPDPDPSSPAGNDPPSGSQGDPGNPGGIISIINNPPPASNNGNGATTHTLGPAPGSGSTGGNVGSDPGPASGSGSNAGPGSDPVSGGESGGLGSNGGSGSNEGTGSNGGSSSGSNTGSGSGSNAGSGSNGGSDSNGGSGSGSGSGSSSNSGSGSDSGSGSGSSGGSGSNGGSGSGSTGGSSSNGGTGSNGISGSGGFDSSSNGGPGSAAGSNFGSNPGSDPGSQPAAPPIGTLIQVTSNGQVISGVALGAQTALPGGAPITDSSGNILSIASNGAVLTGVSLATGANGNPIQGIPVAFTSAGQSVSGVIVGSQTLLAGAPAQTIAGVPVSVPIGGFPGQNPSQPITVNGAVVTPQAGGVYDLSGSSLTVNGAPVTVGGTVYALSTNAAGATEFVESSAGGAAVTADIGSYILNGLDAASADAGGEQTFFTAPNGQVETASIVSDGHGGSAVVIDGTTLSVGGRAVTIDGQVVSGVTAGFVVGTGADASSIVLSSTARSGEVGAVFTGTDGALETALAVPGQSGEVVVDGTTLSVGGEAATVDGVVVSEGSHGLVVGTGSTATTEALTSLSGSGGSLPAPTSAANPTGTSSSSQGAATRSTSGTGKVKSSTVTLAVAAAVLLGILLTP
ncbi:MAG: hypothetical protein M1820_000757 [Bogoriella megaspora]|nr:MAG: hypothetical protein M1820_000757 [Bogoriella megaspora]